VCENVIVRSLCSRSASSTRNENAASITSNIASQESVSENELERNVRNVERDNQNVVGLSTNSNVTSGSDESPISAKQLHSILAEFMADMQAKNATLASSLESKLNKLSENLDAKLASVSNSLDAKLNLVSDSLNTKLNSIIANVTSEMTNENDRMRQ
jgi:ABC-type Zn2+ transport system substrate-binding protein/surface adhesin